MTDNEIRIAIAEHLGIKVEPCTCKAYPWRNAETKKHIPDYPSDLNACAEFEATMRIGLDRCNTELREYRNHLAKIIGCAWYQSAQMICAKPPQRCEAFLRVKGLWRE